MILLDLSQIILATLMTQTKGGPIDENLIRHMALNSIRANRSEFKSKYGELVICCDSRKSWRKEYFPFYKANRKKDRDASPWDWKMIFETISLLKEELKQYFPYKVIEVEGAEADDIIATLAVRHAKSEPVLILSSDKDFVQLQKYPGITQYSPLLKKFVTSDDPKRFIKEHIMRGDRSDGIPNFMSPDNVFATDGRQRRLNTKKINDWIDMDPEQFCDTQMLRGFKRNQMLIDLDFTPEAIREQIVSIFDGYETKSKMNKMRLMNYFIEKKLKNLLDCLNEF